MCVADDLDCSRKLVGRAGAHISANELLNELIWEVFGSAKSQDSLEVKVLGRVMPKLVRYSGCFLLESQHRFICYSLLHQQICEGEKSNIISKGK